MTMLLGALLFLCLPVLAGKANEMPQICNVILLIPVVSGTVLAGRQDRTSGNIDCIMPHITHSKHLFRDYRHRLG